MQVGPYDIALIGGAFTLLGALITYWFATELGRRQARRDAGRKLREAFADEISAMNPVTGRTDVTVEYLLQQAFLKHYAAMREFSFHLAGRERESFEAAWKNYYEVGRSTRFFDYYMSENGRQEFQRRVDELLRFTAI